MVIHGVWSYFEIRDTRKKVALITVKNGEDPITNDGTRVLTTPNIYFSDIQGQLSAIIHGIRSNFQLIRDIMVVLVTTNNDEDPIKMKAGHG